MLLKECPFVFVHRLKRKNSPSKKKCIYANIFVCEEPSQEHLLKNACFFFSSLLFQPQKSQSLGLFYWGVSRQWTKQVGHFYPGGSGIAKEGLDSPKMSHERMMIDLYKPLRNDFFFFFPSRLFAAIGLRSRSCFTGQLPGIGTVFILATHAAMTPSQPPFSVKPHQIFTTSKAIIPSGAKSWRKPRQTHRLPVDFLHLRKHPHGLWFFALGVRCVPGACPVKQSEPETVAEKGARQKKRFFANWYD